MTQTPRAEMFDTLSTIEDTLTDLNGGQLTARQAAIISRSLAADAATLMLQALHYAADLDSLLLTPCSRP